MMLNFGMLTYFQRETGANDASWYGVHNVSTGDNQIGNDSAWVGHWNDIAVA